MFKFLVKVAAVIGAGYVVNDMIKAEVRRQLNETKEEKDLSVNDEEVACEDFFVEAEEAVAAAE